MFSSEVYGYNKKEVEEYIASLKSEHERTLMEERLKVLEAEKRILDIKKKTQEIESREQNILSVLESYRKAQAEGSRNIEVLRGEQLRMVYLHLQSFLKDLNTKVPGVLLNSNYRKLITDIEMILGDSDSKKEELVGAGTQSDSMRILLSKMQGKKTQEAPKEVRIERNTYKPSQIKPVTQMQLNENDDYDNLVDKFLNSAPPEAQPKSMKIQSSGFDLKEAVNPKQDLSEIMKAFDFYSSDDDED